MALSLEDKQKIIELYNQGVKPEKIAEIFKIHPVSVGKIRRKFGVSAQFCSRLSKEEKMAAYSRYIAGESSEEIAKDLKRDGNAIRKAIIELGGEIRPPALNKRKYKINEDYFENIDTEEKAYWLGMLYADGSVSATQNGFKLSLKSDDIDVIKKLSVAIYGNEEHIKIRPKKEGSCETANIYVYGEKICNDLKKWGCTPQKSFTIRFPTNLRQDLIRHFIRGYSDGDGCISISKINRVIYDITSSYDFIEDLNKLIINMLNIYPFIRHNSYNKLTGYLQISSKDNLLKFFDYLYKGASIYMGRKYNTYKKALNILGDSTDQNKYNLVDFWFDRYREKGFPYPTLTDLQLNQQFDILQKASTDLVFKGGHLHLNNSCGNKIIKHFNKHFYEISGHEKPSLIDAFNDDLLLRKAINNRLDQGFKISDKMIIQGLRNSFTAFHPSVFPPMIAKHIYNKYCKDGDVAYDYSFGFGNRLLGLSSLNKNIKYIGTDPWSKNVNAVNGMVKYYNLQNVRLYQDGAENFCPKEYEDGIDFAFSSPPYYNKEVYNDEVSQCYNNRSYQEFLHWWDKVCKNAYKMIKTNGLFALNICDNGAKYNIADDMKGIMIKNGFQEFEILKIKTSKNNTYLNREKDKFEYIFVLKKI